MTQAEGIHNAIFPYYAEVCVVTRYDSYAHILADRREVSEELASVRGDESEFAFSLLSNASMSSSRNSSRERRP